MAHLRRLLCCSSLALVAAKRRSPSERTPERRGPRRGLLFGDADPERYYNASWTPGPPLSQMMTGAGPLSFFSKSQ